MSEGQSLLICVSVFIPTSSYWDKIHVHIHCGLPPSQREMRFTCWERETKFINKGAEKISRERGHVEEHKTTREESRGSAMATFNHQADILESPGR